MRSRVDSSLPPAFAFTESSSAGTFGGGGGGGVPSSTSITHLPRSTGEVRSGDRRERQDAALARAVRGGSAASARAGTPCPLMFGMP